VYTGGVWGVGFGGVLGGVFGGGITPEGFTRNAGMLRGEGGQKGGMEKLWASSLCANSVAKNKVQFGGRESGAGGFRSGQSMEYS